jgi:hypothetical protein
MIVETSVDRDSVMRKPGGDGLRRALPGNLVGERAAHPLAPSRGRMVSLLLLAGRGPAWSLLSAKYPRERTIGRVQLGFPG